MSRLSGVDLMFWRTGFWGSVPLSLVGGSLLCTFFLSLGLLSCIWLPYDINQIGIGVRFSSPSALHWFGTDHLGRDLLSLIMAGTYVSLAISFIGVGIGIFLGVPLGLVAAAHRGKFLDEFLMRCSDVWFSFPVLLIAVLIASVFSSGAFNAILAIGIFNIPVFIRLTRASALSLWEGDFVKAAKISGKGRILISLEHILPLIMPLLIIQISTQISLGILWESALSYTGLGVQPPLPSWGRLVADARTFVLIAPHLVLIPGIIILLMALGLNLVGEGLRAMFTARQSNWVS